MAMLAEKRSKQKWSEDPRNIAWSKGKYSIDDINKISVLYMTIPGHLKRLIY